ncbi:hypothetical protein P6166_12240 [Stenotrophomonas sp. HITSZ_GD]|uniref:hypothetical protein n=1 Tax=Stenotrophomonas sp. HITSZ_GD TaxID=3037248 RepID=UPI00240DF79D|nr:hypothetical protein [Stenotrophomonas sp. HITSZ_GD]MDG2526125.1 hypothetical protein [Stenotrophomonas sp. HITSZ_GD]
MESPRSFSLRAWWGARPRWLRRMGGTLVGIYAAYLLLANLFLNTPLGPWAANRKPEKFTAQWGLALSAWPGHVRAWDVHLKGHVMHTRWEVRAARVRGHVALMPLFHRQVRVPLVVAEEVSGGALRDPGVPVLPPRYDPKAPPGWTLRFDRIASDSVRDGYFGDLRLQGQGRAEVGFSKQMRGGAMALMPSHASFTGATLRQRGQVLLHDARLEANFSLDPHRRDQAAGLDKLLKLDARLRLQGSTAALSLARDAQGRPVLRAAPGQGTADIDLHWLRGELAPAGRLAWRAPLAGTRLDGQPLQGEVRVDLAVDRDIVVHALMPEQPGANLKLDADLRLQGRRVPLRDFTTLVPRANGHVLMQWRFPSLGWITAMFPQAQWLQLRGEGQVDADVQVRGGQLAPGSRVSVPQASASAEVMGHHIEGQAQAELRVEGEAGALVPALDLQMQRFVIADEARRPFVEGEQLRLEVRAGAGERTAAGLRQSAAARLVFRNARVPDLRAYNRFLPAAQLRFEGGGGTLSGDLAVAPGGTIAEGRLQVAARGARAHAAGIALSTDLDADLRLRQADLRGQNFTLDASTVALRNVRFTGPDGQPRSGWWATIALPRARMDWTRPIRLDADARVKVRDLGFLLALYSQKRDFPSWVGKVVDAGQTQVSGRVFWHADQLVLDRVQAGNDRFTVLARLKLQGSRREGDLFANWGVLSAALETEGGQRNWHLIRARQWYDAQPALLR